MVLNWNQLTVDERNKWLATEIGKWKREDGITWYRNGREYQYKTPNYLEDKVLQEDIWRWFVSQQAVHWVENGWLVARQTKVRGNAHFKVACPSMTQLGKALCEMAYTIAMQGRL